MQPKKSNSNRITQRKLWELLGTACIFLSTPLIVISLILLYIYRCLVEIMLRIQLKSKFAGLLKGTDCVWATEDTVSLSVINILMILEKAENSNAIFLEDFRNLVNDRVVSKAAGTTLEKLFYLRGQKFGYYFWEKSEKIDLKNRIRWLECVNANCDGSCEDISGESFRKTLENVCNKSLPDNHRAAWEILVGGCCLKSKYRVKKSYLSPEKCFSTDIQKIPIVFRVHHSLGDGVALIDLLLKTIIEKDVKKEMRVKIKDIISAEVRFCSILHGPPQTGQKIISYWLENNVINNKSQNLLTKIREIRKITGAKFEDIVLTAFSASVHKYHLCINEPIPDALTTILPIRMSAPDENLTLDNKFSIVILRVCISNANGQTIVEPNRDSQFFKRLQDITRTNNELRKSSDVLFNFWIIKYLSALLPIKILKAFLLSHSTMAFSNMCGPEKVRILNNSLNHIVFWIPNKSTTALGFSLLSYGGKLHLSLMADKSIVKDERFFMELLENTVHEIDTAYNCIISRRFSKH